MNTIKVKNIAELKTRKGITESIVEVLGYYTEGDGGGGNFYWDNTSAEIDNGGTILSVSTVGTGRWIRIINTDSISVKFFGSFVDGNDNTNRIQAAVNYLLSVGGGKLLFHNGVYNISQIIYYEGISFIGSNSTVFKKIPSTDKFLRMFTQPATPIIYSQDSKPCLWENITFDGNSQNASPYRNYELEHQHMIFLSASKDGQGRLVAFINNCTFNNVVADAVSVYNNVNLFITNCSMKDCFRGGLVVTGGYSIVKFSNLHMKGNIDLSRLDVEIDGEGYNGTLNTLVQGNNSYIENGFDLSGLNVNASLDNIITKKGSVTIGDSHESGNILIYNSSIYMSVADEFINRIYGAKYIKFSNCNFTYFRPTGTVGIKNFGVTIYWNNSAEAKVIFDNCEFNVDSSIQSTDTVVAVDSLFNSYATKNEIIFNNCTINKGFDRGICNRGGTTKINNTVIDAVLPLRLDSADATGYKFSTNNVSLGSTATQWMHIVVGSPNGVLEHHNIYIDETQSNVTTDYGYTAGTTASGITGRRTIFLTSAPSYGTVGIVGDIARLKNPLANTVYEWICLGMSGPDYIWKTCITVAA